MMPEFGEAGITVIFTLTPVCIPMPEKLILFAKVF
jgi:hypothetical protein